MEETVNSYIFGYGGLILSESRQMTLGAEVEAVPAILSGFERFWGFTAPEYRLTTVSLRANNSKTCVGVIFPVTPRQLRQLDLREKGYKRIELPKKNIHLLEPQNPLIDGTIHTYITHEDVMPSLDNPITQSDIDAILTGCLKDYGEAFAREVVRTTSGWEGPWIDDRDTPRYPWSFHDSRFTQLIDQILKDVAPTKNSKP